MPFSREQIKLITSVMIPSKMNLEEDHYLKKLKLLNALRLAYYVNWGMLLVAVFLGILIKNLE